jgi:hypothetical protein
MARSVVVEVRKAIIDGIAAALADESVSVSYGWRGGDDERREQIYTNRPRATHEPAALKSGRSFRTESMTFDIVLLVMNPTDPPEDVDDRVMDLGQVIEEFIADRKSNELGVAGLNWIGVSAFEMQNQILPTGSMTVAQWAVARLT